MVGSVNGSAPAEEQWQGLDSETDVTVKLTIPEDWSIAEVMRLRGAMTTASPMLTAGIDDLTRASGDVRLDLALAIFANAGEAALSAFVAGIDEWLDVKAVPRVSLFPVRSSNLAAMGWADGVAVVEFQNGSLYAYDGLPEDMFAEWWTADSVGGYLAHEVKPAFEAVKLA